MGQLDADNDAINHQKDIQQNAMKIEEHVLGYNQSNSAFHPRMQLQSTDQAYNVLQFEDGTSVMYPQLHEQAMDGVDPNAVYQQAQYATAYDYDFAGMQQNMDPGAYGTEIMVPPGYELAHAYGGEMENDLNQQYVLID